LLYIVVIQIKMKRTNNELKENLKYVECKSIISDLKEQLRRLDMEDSK